MMLGNKTGGLTMVVVQRILSFLDYEMKTPRLFGWFHIVSLILVAVVTFFLCYRHKQDNENRVRSVVLTTALLVIALEIYKQINYSFSYTNGITFDYQWYAFPFQFCSTPMYIGLLAGLLPQCKLRDALYCYLATFAVFAGAAVMVYPGDVFVKTVGINIQTMICHGSMICIGVYLFYTGAVKLEHKTLLKAVAVFSCTLSIAVIMNEIAHATGLLERETFNMFFVSRYCEPSLPVYSVVQGIIPYPWSLLIYILGFSAAAYVMLLLAMMISRIASRNKLKLSQA